jgi:predicted tellurium resistance membrane protein TerC
MNRYPWIVWLGGGILGYVAGEMMLKDRVVQQWIGDDAIHALHYPLPLVLGIGITALGWWFAQAMRRRRKIPEHL